MKFALPVLLCCCSGACLATPEVQMRLHSFRSEMNPHGQNSHPALTLKLEFASTGNYTICETDRLPGEIKVTDATGNSHVCAPAALRLTENDKHVAIAEFNLEKRPKGKEIKIEGELEVTVATGLEIHSGQDINLLNPASFLLGNVECHAEPDKKNGDKENLEGPMLKHAALLLRYPIEINILHISRIWCETTPEADSEATGCTQELKFKTEFPPDGSERQTRLELWDASPVERLQFITCQDQHRVKIPVQFTLTLGEVSDSSEKKQ